MGMYSVEYAEVLLASMSSQQASDLYEYCSTHTREQVLAAVNREHQLCPTMTPLLSCLDPKGVLNIDDVRALLVSVTAVLQAAELKTYRDDDYKKILRLATGMNADLAEDLASTITTPDCNVDAWGEQFLDKIEAVPFAPGLIKPVLEATQGIARKVLDWYKNEQKGVDTRYEFLLLGRAILEGMKRAFLQMGTAAVGARVHPENFQKVLAEAGNPWDEGESDNPFDEIVAATANVPEDDIDLDHLKEQFSAACKEVLDKAEARRILGAMRRASAEEGNIFGDILGGIGSVAGSIIPGAGTVVGGLAGKLGGDLLGKVIGGSKKSGGGSVGRQVLPTAPLGGRRRSSSGVSHRDLLKAIAEMKPKTPEAMLRVIIDNRKA